MIKNNIFIYIFSFFLLVLGVFHSHILGYFGVEEYIVSGNYEFTKVSLFNILTPLLFFVYFIINVNKNNPLDYNKKIIYISISIYILLAISTYFSAIPNNSFFGGVNKGHGFIFLNNLFLLFFIIYHLLSHKGGKYIHYGTIITIFFITIIGIKEYYLPSYNYGDLSNRLVSTLGHPNYVSALYLVIFPYLFYIFKRYNGYKKYFIFTVGIIFIFGLLLTKSYIAIFLLGNYFIYEIISKKYKKYFLYIVWLLGTLGIISIFYFFPEKLNSLISRFYIWETTIKIIFSDIKIFFLGIGGENMNLFFNNYKSIELYLYENIGFTADRPHNIFLNIWLHYGIILFIGALLGIKYLLGFIKNNPDNWSSISLLLLIIFWCFNFPNILGYILFILLLTQVLIKNYRPEKNNYITVKIFIGILGIFSFIGSYFSIKQYISQAYIKQNNYSQAVEVFPFYGEYHFNMLDFESGLEADNNIRTENYLLYKIYFSFEKIPECDTLVIYYPSIENYLYCGNIIESKFGWKKARYYYENAIKMMPDIWDKKSKYLENIFLKRIINPERILHPKFSNIQDIINKLEK